MSATWYVTVGLHKSGVLPRPRHPRLTTTFETQTEAKTFARVQLSEGLIVFVGKVSPFSPRWIVASHDVATWVADEGDLCAKAAGWETNSFAAAIPNYRA